MYPPEAVEALLTDLAAAGLVKAVKGAYEVTAAGRHALGGIVYADHPELRTDPDYAAYYAGTDED